jgi:hypothetical protein
MVIGLLRQYQTLHATMLLVVVPGKRMYPSILFFALLTPIRTSPYVANPDYKGKWYAPMIDNPAYKGEWAPRKIPNPDYFEDLMPVKSLNKIVNTTISSVKSVANPFVTGWCWN